MSSTTRRTDLDGATLTRAIGATFARRGTALPAQPPVALTANFGADTAKQRQWSAFLKKGHLDASTLAETVDLLHALLWPATQVAASASDATASWQAEQRWV